MATQQGVGKGTRPAALAVQPDGIPGELKRLKRWVLWRYEWNPEKGKWEKPPVSPASGHKTSVQRPGGWGTFSVALTGYERKRGNADGIGIVLSSGPDDPLDLAGIDIDDPSLVPLLRPLGTYTEQTPTAGKGGARALFRGKLPEGCACRAAGAEVYEGGRYFTVTGRRLSDFPQQIARPDPDTLAAVLRSLGLLGAAPAPPPPVEAREAVEAKPCADDERRLGAAFAAANGAAFRRLWEGDPGDYLDKDGRPDASRADLALCNFLAFYWEKDAAAVDRMFRRSGLFRAEKWDARHYQTGETYGQHTVSLAVRDCRATYTGRRHTSNGEAVAPKASTASRASTGVCGAGPGAGVAPRPGANGHAPAPPGRPWISAADLPDDEPDYFWEPYIERGILSLLCGRTGAGKSTLLAHLAGMARRPAFLPGFEEGRGGKLRRRLAAAGVDLGPVGVLRRRYYLPSQAQALLADLRAMGADLCIIDPMISYLDPGLKSTDEDAIRPFLEALAGVAADLAAPVVGVRHSGKGRNPVKGSTAWEEVPRSILELLQTQDGQARRVLRHYKAGGEGPAAPPAYFEIAGPKGAGRFVLGRPVDPALACSLDAASDPEEGGKIEEVQALIKVLMSEGQGVDRREAGWMLRYCQTQVGCSAATVQRARRMLGVTSKSDMHGPGTKHYWHPPEGGRWPE